MYWAVLKRRERERGRDRVETEGTRGESLREWAKERERFGVLVQKVRIIREASCQTSQQLIPGGTRESKLRLYLVYLLHLFAQALVDIPVFRNGREREGQTAMSVDTFVVLVGRAQNLFHVHFGKNLGWNRRLFVRLLSHDLSLARKEHRCCSHSSR